MKDTGKQDDAIRQLMAFDGTDGAAPPLDELTTRRWVNDMVTAADRLPPMEESSAGRPGFGRSRRLAALVAVAAVALLALLLWQLIPSEENRQVDAARSTTKTSQLAMVSGDVWCNGELVNAHYKLTAGDRIVAEQGETMLQLSGGVTVYLDSGSELLLSSPNHTPPAVHLVRGRLVSAVEKHPVGTLAFAVTTHAGNVEVTGTVFSVTAAEKTVDVQVLEGRVNVNNNRQQSLTVDVGEGLVLSSSSTRSLSTAEKSLLVDSAATLELFRPQHPSMIVVRSEPSRAEVLVDSTSMGRTPLSVSLEPGERRLSIHHEGYREVNKTVVARPGEILTQDIELAPLYKSPAPISSDVPNPLQKREAIDAPAKDGSRSLTTPYERIADELTPEILLRNAMTDRKRGDWPAVAMHYRTILDVYPKSAEVGAALTGLGELHVAHLNAPQKALDYFDMYLERQPGGVLAQEAWFGRIRALRKLGRFKDELVAISAFIERFPDSVQTKRLQARLRDLEGPPSTIE